MEKFAGVGLINIFIIWLFVVLLTVSAKVIFTKFPVPGVSEVIHAV